MAMIPKQDRDPTLEAVDAAIEGRGNAEPPRPYLGMSEIGNECSRALWYGFRWCSPSTFDAATLKRFEDGHLGEDLQAERLCLVPGLELYTEDPNNPGEQIGFADLAGHFQGHADGTILGLIQAPKTWHVWEHKQTAEKKQTQLVAAKTKHGEKGALKEWNPVYYAQAVLYMRYSGMKRHYLTCSTPGGRHTVSVRTDKDDPFATALIEKAKRIITAEEPPARISERPDWYKCKWCRHHATCHEGAIPAVSCRTCIHSTPELDGAGRWSCAALHCDLPTDTQRQGAQCPKHLFLPALLPWLMLDASEEGWIEYEKPDGTKLRNGLGYYASREIKDSPEICGDAIVDKIKDTMGGEVVG